jgi:hypothetical protein
VLKEYPRVEIKKGKIGNKTKSLAYCSLSPSPLSLTTLLLPLKQHGRCLSFSFSPAPSSSSETTGRCLSFSEINRKKNKTIQIDNNRGFKIEN